MTLRRVLRETNTFLSCTSVTGVGRGKCISENETPLQGTGVVTGSITHIFLPWPPSCCREFEPTSC